MSVNIGVIGTGMIGQDHIRRTSEVLAGGRIAAVTDIDTARAAAVADQRGAKAFTDAHELIASPAVDAVMVTSFGPAHEEAVIAAIEDGKPVFCEKPLTPTAQGCLNVMAVEAKAGKRLVQVGFMRRFDASYRAMKSRLDSGALGRALMVHCAHRNPTVPQTYTLDMAINDTAIHEVDAIRWLLGEEIVSVRVDKPRRTTNRFDHLQDPIVFIMTTESGVRIDDEIFVNARYGYDIRCELVAEEGTLALTDQALIAYRDVRGAGNRITEDWRDRFVAAYDTEIQAWIHSVTTGVTVGPSVWDGYAAAAVCDAGVRALGADEERIEVEMAAKPELYR